MTEQTNFLPHPLTDAAGFEIEKMSLLGPFLSLSVFAEDNVSSLPLTLSDFNVSCSPVRLLALCPLVPRVSHVSISTFSESGAQRLANCVTQLPLELFPPFLGVANVFTEIHRIAFTS